MKLNPNCVRDILLTVKETVTIKHHILINMFYNNDPYNFNRLINYSNDEIRYHIKQCSQYEFIEIISFTHDHIIIKNLTPIGNNLLSNIYLYTNWNKVNLYLETLGNYSLGILPQVAAYITSNRIKK